MCIWITKDEDLLINIELITDSLYISKYTMNLYSEYSIKQLKKNILKQNNLNNASFYISIEDKGHLYGWKKLQNTDELKTNTIIRVLYRKENGKSNINNNSE